MHRMPREILTDWTTPAGGGFVTVMFFDSSVPVATQRTSLQGFYFSLRGVLDTGVSNSIRTAGRELNDSTGGLTGAWSEPTVHTNTGTVAGEPVPDATQMLFRWSTDQIVAGRFLQGRTFIPGLTDGNMTDGNINSAAIPGLVAVGQDLIQDAVGFGVWHRPSSGTGGVFHEATTCSVWDELAVLRRRRH